MVKFVNAVTGGEMWVHESRVAEYLAAGHILAAAPAPGKGPEKNQEKGPEKGKRTKKSGE